MFICVGVQNAPELMTRDTLHQENGCLADQWYVDDGE